MKNPGELVDGRYLLGREIGRGAHGQVFAATDTEDNRLVAVKVLNPMLEGDDQFIQRLWREARSMAAILGESGLPDADRRALGFAEQFEREFIAQGRARRNIGDTLKAGWRLLDTMPRDDLARLSEATWQRRKSAQEGAT